MEIYPISVPLPFESPSSINVYCLVSNEVMLIDSGYNWEKGLQIIQESLNSFGISFENITQIVGTHGHPDHIGLSQRILSTGKGDLLMHPKEQALMDMYNRPQRFSMKLQEWAKLYGIPLHYDPLIQTIPWAHSLPDISCVTDGDRITRSLIVIWTPGHTPGHICLYDQEKKIIFSGDILLEDITPNVSFTPSSSLNPMKDYLNSLERLLELPAKTVFPSHGKPIRNWKERARFLIHHCQNRLKEVSSILDKTPKSLLEIASMVHWDAGDFADLDSFNKKLALGEVLAYIRYLTADGKAKEVYENVVLFKKAE
jgi:glyoxylase-like metal-dependent hydrolase (beta-lactamase superfamily II)